ncbi:Proline--tRNA ligase [uncultured archaeon]|nr:Proline--tRNA ligase [uncultured archaeon]
MAHGDDKGLVLPPKIAPVQAVIIPILFEKTKGEVLAEASKIQYSLEEAGIRAHLDARDAYSPGFKFNEWELKGVPLRIEIGPRDIKNGEVILARRDTGEKRNVKITGLKNAATIALESIQASLFVKSRKFVETHITEVKDYAIFKKIVEDGGGFAQISWCGDSKCEEKIKEETGATLRVIPFDEKVKPKSKCVYCGKDAKESVYAARAY